MSETFCLLDITVNLKTAGILLVELGFQNCYNKRAVKLYNTIIDKYIHAEPATSRIARKMTTKSEIANNSIDTTDDLNKVNTSFTSTFRGDDKFFTIPE